MAKKLLTTFAFVLLAYLSGAQGITSVNPGVGNRGQTLPLIVSGQNTNFSSQASATLFLKQGSFTISQGTMTVVNSNRVDAVITIPSNAPLGFYDLFVNSGSFQSKSAAFVVKQGTNTSNMLVQPAGGKPGNTLTNISFHIPGAQFKSNQSVGINSVWFSKGSQVLNTATNITVINPNTFTADVMIPSGTTQGKWNVNVLTNDDISYTKSEGFLIDQTFVIGEWGISLNDFKLYPNPTTDYLHLEFDQNVNSDLKVVVLDMTGKVLKADFEVNYDDKIIKTDVADLPKGNYVIQLTYKDHILSSKKWIHN